MHEERADLLDAWWDGLDQVARDVLMDNPRAEVPEDYVAGLPKGAYTDTGWREGDGPRICRLTSDALLYVEL